MDSALLAQVRDEIERLHRFFVRWFAGTVAETDDVFENGFFKHLDPSFLLIPPAGTVTDLSGLGKSIRAAHGSNPDFRIAIRNASIRGTWDDHVLVTYEEWQRNALASTPPDNARVASAIFRSGESLKWLHVHETWLPKAMMEAGPYDF